MYMPYMFISPRYKSVSLTVKIVTCLFFNVALSYGGQLLGMFEGQGKIGYYVVDYIGLVFRVETMTYSNIPKRQDMQSNEVRRGSQ